MEHDRDFLDGIDEEFERRMKLYGNGASNGRNGGSSSRRRDALSMRILELLDALSSAQKEEAILYIQSLKEGAPAKKKTTGSSERSSE